MDDIRSQRLQELEDSAMAYDADPYPDKRLAFSRILLLDRAPNEKEASTLKREAKTPAGPAAYGE